MSSANIYENNPLHGIGLEQVLTELVDHYGFEILDAYLNLNCFKNNPSIKSSVKFLKKQSGQKIRLKAFIYINLKVYLVLTIASLNYLRVIA